MSDIDAEYLRRLERERLASLVARDLETAGRLHADDYELINPGGMAISKADYLGDLESGAIRYVTFEPETDVRVHIRGEAAIVRYRARIDIRFPNDGRDGGIFWHTDYYEHRDGRWQAVWSQATRTAEGVDDL